MKRPINKYPHIMMQMFMRGWNNSDLAEKADISYWTLCYKLRGSSSFSLDEALKIKKAFGCNIDIETLFAKRENLPDETT